MVGDAEEVMAVGIDVMVVDRFQSNNGDSSTCNYCGKKEHLVKFCPMRISEESTGIIRNPNQHQPNQ